MNKESNQVTKMVDDLIAQGEIVVVWEDIDDVREKAKNPRKIKPAKFEELKQSITQFPQMMRFRPGIAQRNGDLLGGNMRHRACKALGWHKFPVVYADGLSDEQVKELIIKDNLDFGSWDNKLLKQDWTVKVLADWGMDVNAIIGEPAIPAEIVFSPELDRESNYVVLKFDKDIDWLHIQTVLGLQSMYGKRANGKPWAKGVGRVVDGVKAIKTIKKSNINL